MHYHGAMAKVLRGTGGNPLVGGVLAPSRVVLWGGISLILGAVVGISADVLFVSLVVRDAPFGYNGATDLPWVLAEVSKALGESLVAVGFAGACALAVGRSGRFKVSVWAGALMVALPTAGFAGLTGYQYVAQPYFVSGGFGSAVAFGYEHVRPLGIMLVLAVVAFGVRGLGRWRVPLLVVGLLGLPAPYALVALLSSSESGIISFWAPQTFAHVGCVSLGLVLLGTRRREAGMLVEENLRLARRLYEEAWGKGSVGVMDELVSQDLRDTYHRERGRESLKRNVAGLRRAFPDLVFALEDQRAEGDTVVTRWKMGGTDTGGVLWYPPTGRRVTFGGTFVDRFSEGRLVEHGGEADVGGLLGQLGLASSGGGPGAI